MTSKEYEQRLEALEREIAALKRENVEDGSEIPPHQRPEMNRGDKNYYINVYGGTSSSVWLNTEWDLKRLHIGNVFLTEEAAKYAEEYFKICGEMREWAGNWDDLWKISYDGCQVEADRDYLNTITYGEMRFAIKEDAEGCIKAVGKDRLIKYYFGVRDHEIPAETE